MRTPRLLVSFLVLLLISQAGLTGCSDSSKASEKIKTGTATTADHTTIAYTDIGVGEVALVFIHGWSCDQSYWRFQRDVFSSGYRVVTIDLAGHGLSSANRADYTIPLFGEDVASVVNKLDLNKVVLVGHSMGGGVMLQAASLLGERIIGMVGIDTLQEMSFNMDEAAVDPFIEAMGRDFPTAAGHFARSMFLASADTNMVNEVVAGMSSASPAVALSAMREYLLFDNSLTLENLNVPLRCIVSRLLPIDMDSWAAYSGGCTFNTMPDVGHFIHMVAPDRFNPLLKEAVEKFSAQSLSH